MKRKENIGCVGSFQLYNISIGVVALHLHASHARVIERGIWSLQLQSELFSLAQPSMMGIWLLSVHTLVLPLSLFTFQPLQFDKVHQIKRY